MYQPKGLILTDVIGTLKGVELFHGMDERQLAAVSAIVEACTYTAGDVVFEQGQDGDALYIVHSGQVEVRVQNADVVDSAVYLGAGQAVGEMALIDQATRSATIIAVDEPTLLYRLPIAAFTRLCQTQTDIGYVLMRNIAQDLSFKLRHRHSDIKRSGRSSV